MKFVRPRTLLIYALTALAGTVLLHTSQSVQHAEQRIAELNASIEREHEKVRLLKAEWASLNRPERLEKLASQFLDLVPPAPETIVEGVAVLPDMRQTPEGRGLFDEEGAGAALQSASASASEPAAGKASAPVVAVPEKEPQAVLPAMPPARDDRSFSDLVTELSGEEGQQ